MRCELWKILMENVTGMRKLEIAVNFLTFINKTDIIYHLFLMTSFEK